LSIPVWAFVNLRTAVVGLLAIGIQAEELRLVRTTPDLNLRMCVQYHAPGERPLSLVLGGGSAKGLAHIGVFEVLDEEIGVPRSLEKLPRESGARTPLLKNEEGQAVAELLGGQGLVGSTHAVRT